MTPWGWMNFPKDRVGWSFHCTVKSRSLSPDVWVGLGVCICLEGYFSPPFSFANANFPLGQTYLGVLVLLPSVIDDLCYYSFLSFWTFSHSCPTGSICISPEFRLGECVLPHLFLWMLLHLLLRATVCCLIWGTCFINLLPSLRTLEQQGSCNHRVYDCLKKKKRRESHLLARKLS